MTRPLKLRQIEAFKALIEFGTVNRAAEMLHISQPAMSQLIAHLEADTGLKLFDRLKGRLIPTQRAIRLYEEVGRIFAGVRQIENAVEAIRREEQGRLAVGVLPALAGSFIQRVTTSFLKERSKVFCSVQSLNSQWVVDQLVARKLDVGLIEPGLASPYIRIEPQMELPLVCIMPLEHPLSAKSLIKPEDLDQVPFVNINPDSYVGRRVEGMFETYRVRAQTVLVANAALTVCEFVAAGYGVSLVHPLVASGLEDRLAVRRFEPEIPNGFQLCRSVDSGNTQLVDVFAEALRATAAQISRSMLNES
jgi:DNA-binding transcriptional LysR family regulator